MKWDITSHLSKLPADSALCLDLSGGNRSVRRVTFKNSRKAHASQKGPGRLWQSFPLSRRRVPQPLAAWLNQGRVADFDPDDHVEEYYDSDEYEDECLGSSQIRAQTSPSTIAALQNMLGDAHRETLAAVQASSVGTAAALSKTASRSFRQVRVAAAGAARAARKSPAAAKLKQARERLGHATAELPEGLWAKLAWLWDFPPVKSLRMAFTAAQWSMHLPTLLAIAATQWSVIFAHVSPTMLAPLLFGGTMLFRSIYTNASIIFPRIGVTAMVLWVLWSANGILQSAVYNLRMQGRIDYRLASTIITCAEILSMITALIILLSMFGINVSALILPAGVAVAFASKDLIHNFLAGFFLLAVQPFKVGDSIGVNVPVAHLNAAYGSYFEGSCCKLDLRFTHIRRGKQRLVVPNATFLTNPFLVLDEGGGAPGVFDRTSSGADASAHHDPAEPDQAMALAGGLGFGRSPFRYPDQGHLGSWLPHLVSPGVPLYNGHMGPMGHVPPGPDAEQHFMNPRPSEAFSWQEEGGGPASARDTGSHSPPNAPRAQSPGYRSVPAGGSPAGEGSRLPDHVGGQRTGDPSGTGQATPTGDPSGNGQAQRTGDPRGTGQTQATGNPKSSGQAPIAREDGSVEGRNGRLPNTEGTTGAGGAAGPGAPEGASGLEGPSTPHTSNGAGPRRPFVYEDCFRYAAPRPGPYTGPWPGPGRGQDYQYPWVYTSGPPGYPPGPGPW